MRENQVRRIASRSGSFLVFASSIDLEQTLDIRCRVVEIVVWLLFLRAQDTRPSWRAQDTRESGTWVGLRMLDLDSPEKRSTLLMSVRFFCRLNFGGGLEALV